MLTLHLSIHLTRGSCADRSHSGNMSSTPSGKCSLLRWSCHDVVPCARSPSSGTSLTTSERFLPLCFSKLAFFFMYTRTFQGRKLRWTLYVSMFLFAGTTILFMTGSMLMNDGIKQSRFEAIKALRYHVQFKYLHYAWGTCDILADLWICLLPLFGLRVLNIGIRRRLWLTLKFAVPAVSGQAKAIKSGQVRC